MIALRLRVGVGPFLLLLLANLLALDTGCTATTVRPNPGRFDRGIRYYRPKPYLLLQPATSKEEKTCEYVEIALHYLPDFSEEYSIHIRAGLGINETTVALENGWNLTNMTVKLDSQTDENISAIGDLMGAIPQRTSANGTMVVKATNVPFGFYESIISQGPDGCKHLYGWRYVGFAPFNQCPLESGGMECTNCQSDVLYALTFQEGAMCFVPIDEVAMQPPVQHEAVKAADPPEPEAEEAKVSELPPPQQDRFERAAKRFLQTNLNVTDNDIGFRWPAVQGTVVAVEIELPAVYAGTISDPLKAALRKALLELYQSDGITRADVKIVAR